MKKLQAIIAFCLLISYTPFSQTISSNAPLCGNANLTLELSATGGTTYAWKGPNSFTSTQQKPSIKNANWKNRGVYTVTIDNKTTLTTDVNIKDPVAFTVPKEISVCEGGTLVIEPKSGRLTDSTEVPEEFSTQNSSGNYTGVQVKNFSSKDIGIYKVTGDVGFFSPNKDKSCPSSQNINVTVKKVTDCKSIEVGDLSKIKMCYGQEISIPFTTKGNFKQGTKFKVYVLRANDNFSQTLQPDAITEKSPAKLKITKYFDGLIKIRIVADDSEQTTIISEPYFYSYGNYVVYNNTSSIISTNSIFCDSVKLSTFISTDSFQWTLDGKDIKNATKSNLTVTKSGSYSIKFKEKFASEINKTCLYESQPLKIELGKIEKPYVSVNNDIELCVGKPVTLNVYSITNTTYRWKKDGNYVANSTKDSYQTLQEGKYQVEAKEGTCTTVSDTVVLKKPERLKTFNLQMKSNLYSSDYINNIATYSLCSNQEYSIFANIPVPTSVKMSWFRDKKLVKDDIGIAIDFLKGEGNYIAKATYGQCEGFSNPINVKYSKVLRGYVSCNNKNVCEGDVNTVYFGSSILQSSDYFKPLSGEIFKDGKVIREWNFTPRAFYTAVPINQSGNYYAQGKVLLNDGNECIVKTDSINITFSKNIQNKAQVSFETCKDTVNLSPNTYYSFSGRETAYKWTKDGITLKQDSSNTLQATQAGIYQLETTYKGGCTVVSLPYKVEFGKLQIFSSFDPNNLTICGGETFNLYGLKLSENQYSDKNISTLYKDSKLFKGNYPYSEGTLLNESGSYRLDVKNGNCTGSYDFTLKVDKIPTSIIPSDSITFCDGKTVELKTSTEAGLSYIWERNSSVISQAIQANYTANADGLYKATLLRGACWGTTPSVKLKLLANIIPTATLTGDQRINFDQEAKLSINLTSHAPWTFKLSDGNEYTATTSPFEVSVKPLSTTTYSLSEVKNICGTGTVSGTAKIEIIILLAEEEKELNVEVFPVPSSEICHWKIETPQVSNASVVLYDVLGVTQYLQASSARTQIHEGTIDLTNMKAGTYFLKLQAGEKSVVRKVVKY